MAITVDTRNDGFDNTSVSSLSYSQVVNSGSDRCLIAGISFADLSSSGITSVTFNGVAMTPVALATWSGSPNSTGNGGLQRVALYRLVAPDVGTFTLQCNFANQCHGHMGSISLFGVHQTTPENAGTPNTNEGTSGQPTVTVTSASGEHVVAVAFKVHAGEPSESVGAGQTQISEGFEQGGFIWGGMSDEASSGSTVTMDYTGFDNAFEWIMAAISLVPAAAGNPLLETLTDNFDDNSFDNTKFSKNEAGGATITEQNQRLEFAGDNGDSALVNGDNPHDLRDSRSFITPAGWLSGDVVDHYVQDPSGNQYFVRISAAGDLQFYKSISGTPTQIGSNIAYDPATHTRWRIRFDVTSGNMLADSADNAAADPPLSGEWTNRWSATKDAAFDATAVIPIFFVLFGGNGRMVSFDGYNTGTTPPAPTGDMVPMLFGGPFPWR